MNYFLINLILGGLATWRLTTMLIEESGPFNLFSIIRDKSKILYNIDSGEVYAGTKLGELLVCPWCLSVWVGGGYGLLILFGNETVFYVLSLPFVFSAMTVLINEWRSSL